jgi:hypothetical protein
MYRKLFFCAAISTFSCMLKAQTVNPAGINSTKQFNWTKKEKIYHPDSSHSSDKAVLRSLILPGWGQVYNRSIWKTPLIYGGLSLLTFSAISNQRTYKEFLTLSRYRNAGAPKKGAPYYDEYVLYTNGNYPVSNERIAAARENARRNRDLCILGIVGIWGIQAIEAYIDGKMIHSYSVDNNLSINIRPGLNQAAQSSNNIAAICYPCIRMTATF